MKKTKTLRSHPAYFKKAAKKSLKAISLEYAQRPIWPPQALPKKPTLWEKVAPTKTQRQIKYAEYRKSAHWCLFRLKIIAERGPYCQSCGSDRRVEVHHLTYARLGCELPDDVRVLCRKCHENAHGIGDYVAFQRLANGAN